MPVEIITHQSIVKEWVTPKQIPNIRTLVLGSFNPYNNNQIDNQLDYHYGRDTNFFWRAIGVLLHNDEWYFFTGDAIERKLEAMANRFACVDVIDSIKISCGNQQLLSDFINDKVLLGYSDSAIWTSKTRDQTPIYLERRYNERILDIIRDTPSLKKVINTMGMDRIGESQASPIEAKLNANGFNGYINRIKEACRRREIDFVSTSYSPSGHAVNARKPTFDQLKEWLRAHLFLFQ